MTERLSWERSAGLTQRQPADRMGTTQSVISRLELAGWLPTLDLLARVATATGSDLRLLVRRAGGNDVDIRLSIVQVGVPAPCTQRSLIDDAA
jgi:transcriptional regulator with XRE-family HTH domain